MRVNFFRNIGEKLAQSADLETYIQWTNRRNKLRRKKHVISATPGEAEEIHIADDGSEKIHICQRGRHNRYKRGVMSGVNDLAKQYSLDLIADLRDGIFIDCGANVGELGFWARERGFQYIPFEPEQLEARCVDLNNFDGETKCIRKALWKEETVLKFFAKADSADSSTIQFDQSSESVEIEAIDLDTAVSIPDDFKGPVIFKLEAEGAEPEILEGARKTISHIDYVTVDCGPERGAEKKHTIVETNRFLTQNGFELLEMKLDRVTALYRRIPHE
ncbi:MAG: FkbM family methyltransferase [Paracoccaceae bacterium]